MRIDDIANIVDLLDGHFFAPCERYSESCHNRQISLLRFFAPEHVSAESGIVDHPQLDEISFFVHSNHRNLNILKL